MSPSVFRSASKKKRYVVDKDELVHENIREIPDLGLLPDPFDLGILRDLRLNDLEVKSFKDAD